MICDESAITGLKAPEDSPWQKPRPPPKRKRELEPDDNTTDPHDDTSDFQRRDDRATTLTKEGQLSKDCSALLDEPPAPCSEKVTNEM